MHIIVKQSDDIQKPPLANYRAIRLTIPPQLPTSDQLCDCKSATQAWKHIDSSPQQPKTKAWYSENCWRPGWKRAPIQVCKSSQLISSWLHKYRRIKHAGSYHETSLYSLLSSLLPFLFFFLIFFFFSFSLFMLSSLILFNLFLYYYYIIYYLLSVLGNVTTQNAATVLQQNFNADVATTHWLITNTTQNMKFWKECLWSAKPSIKPTTMPTPVPPPGPIELPMFPSSSILPFSMTTPEDPSETEICDIYFCASLLRGHAFSGRIPFDYNRLLLHPLL